MAAPPAPASWRTRSLCGLWLQLLPWHVGGLGVLVSFLSGSRAWTPTFPPRRWWCGDGDTRLWLGTQQALVGSCRSGTVCGSCQVGPAQGSTGKEQVTGHTVKCHRVKTWCKLHCGTPCSQREPGPRGSRAREREPAREGAWPEREPGVRGSRPERVCVVWVPFAGSAGRAGGRAFGTGLLWGDRYVLEGVTARRNILRTTGLVHVGYRCGRLLHEGQTRGFPRKCPFYV